MQKGSASPKRATFTRTDLVPNPVTGAVRPALIASGAASRLAGKTGHHLSRQRCTQRPRRYVIWWRTHHR